MSLAWTRRPERGSTALVALMAWLTLRLGEGLGRALLVPISLYFLATGGPARAASRAYLARVLGRAPRLADLFRHIHAFAAVQFDRLLFAAGRAGRFRLDCEGVEYLQRLVEARRGALLLGAHLGSFEALRLLATRACPVPVKALMHRPPPGPLTAWLARRDPAFAAAVIEVGRPGSMLAVAETIAAGGFVGVLADRAPRPERMVRVPFLGAPAAFPAGPMALAAALGAPVLLCRAVRIGRAHYALRFEPFADPLVLPRAERAAALAAAVARYAAWLEAACRAHPFSWFNFFDVWDNDAATAPPAAAHPGHPSAGHPSLGADPPGVRGGVVAGGAGLDA